MAFLHSFTLITPVITNILIVTKVLRILFV